MNILMHVFVDINKMTLSSTIREFFCKQFYIGLYYIFLYVVVDSHYTSDRAFLNIGASLPESKGEMKVKI